MKIFSKILFFSFLFIISISLSWGYVQSESHCFEKSVKVESCLDCLCLRQATTSYNDSSWSKIKMRFLYNDFDLFFQALEENKMANSLFRPPNVEVIF